jgi:hypothetical protein
MQEEFDIKLLLNEENTYISDKLLKRLPFCKQHKTY